MRASRAPPPWRRRPTTATRRSAPAAATSRARRRAASTTQATRRTPIRASARSPTTAARRARWRSATRRRRSTPPSRAPASPPTSAASRGRSSRPATAARSSSRRHAVQPSAPVATPAPVAAQRSCLSVRKFRIRLRVPKGERVRSATVFVNGKKVAVRRGKRLTATIDLRGLPLSRYRVRIVLKLANGDTVHRRPPVLDLHAGDPPHAAAEGLTSLGASSSPRARPGDGGNRKRSGAAALQPPCADSPSPPSWARSPRRARRRREPAQPEHELRQEPPVRGPNGGAAQLRHRHRVRASSAVAVRARRLVPQRPADRRHHAARAARAIAAVYDCGVTQGDVQVFRQADEPGRTFVTYTSDTYGDGTSTCYKEAAALGFDALKEDGTGKNGTFIVDVTDPPAAQDRLVRRGPAGLAQPDRAPERQLPLQLELGPHHVAPAGDRDHRHLATPRRRRRRRAAAAARAPASAPSRTTSPSTPTARAPTRPRSRRA